MEGLLNTVSLSFLGCHHANVYVGETYSFIFRSVTITIKLLLTTWHEVGNLKGYSSAYTHINNSKDLQNALKRR